MDKQEIDWCGHAFPQKYIDEDYEVVNLGLTMREYIAIRAMQSLIIVINEDRREADEPEWVANRAVQYADALLKRLGEDDVSE